MTSPPAPHTRAPISMPQTEGQTATVAACVDGWLSETQGRELFRAVEACAARGAVVEIGSWKGRSTVWLAAAARRAGTIVYAIDRHEASREDPSARTYDEFRRNLEAVGLIDHVRALVMSSGEAERVRERFSRRAIHSTAIIQRPARRKTSRCGCRGSRQARRCSATTCPAPPIQGPGACSSGWCAEARSSTGSGASDR